MLTSSHDDGSVASSDVVRERWDGPVPARRGAAAWAVADLPLRQPVVAVETAARATGVSTVDAAKALRTPTDAGVVAEFSGRRPNRPWRVPEIISALDEFTRRAGRRR